MNMNMTYHKIHLGFLYSFYLFIYYNITIKMFSFYVCVCFFCIEKISFLFAQHF